MIYSIEEELTIIKEDKKSEGISKEWLSLCYHDDLLP